MLLDTCMLDVSACNLYWASGSNDMILLPFVNL